MQASLILRMLILTSLHGPRSGSTPRQGDVEPRHVLQSLTSRFLLFSWQLGAPSVYAPGPS